MKSPSPVLKVAVISFFIFLLCSFVAYRSGVFDKWIHDKSVTTKEPVQDTSKNVPSTAQVETSAPAKDTLPAKFRDVVLSSSKSIMISDDKLKLDISALTTITSEKKKANMKPDSLTTKANEDSFIIKSNALRISTPDTLSSHPRAVRPRTVLFSGSKSGYVIPPIEVKSEVVKPVMPSSKFGPVIPVEVRAKPDSVKKK